VAGRSLDVLQARPVLQRHCDERRPHRVGTVASFHSNPPRVMLEDPSDLLVPEGSPGREVQAGAGERVPGWGRESAGSSTGSGRGPQKIGRRVLPTRAPRTETWERAVTSSRPELP
jgi:hypothetical protein